MAKKDLKQLDGMIKQILNVSHDAIVVSDNNMDIIYVNKVALDLFGYSEQEMIGMKIFNLLPERKKENYIRDKKNILEKKVTISNVQSGEEFFAQKKDGTEFSIELTWISWEGRSKNLYNIAQIRDISRRKVYEKDLEISNRALLVMSECNKALVNAEDEKSYYSDICNLLVENGSYKIAWIGLVKHDKAQSIEPIAYKGLEKGYFEDEIIAKGRMTWKLREVKKTHH
jgi:PAS domain S-box-containing protein